MYFCFILYFIKWASQLWTQFKELRIETWKSEDFNGVWTSASRYQCNALTNWAMKPLTLGAGHLWVLISPWRMDVKWYMKCFICWTVDLESSQLWSSQLWTEFKKEDALGLLSFAIIDILKADVFPCSFAAVPTFPSFPSFLLCLIKPLLMLLVSLSFLAFLPYFFDDPGKYI